MPFDIAAHGVKCITATIGPEDPEPGRTSAWVSIFAGDAWTREKSEVTMYMHGADARLRAQAYADAINEVTARLIPVPLMPCGREACGEIEWCGEKCPHPNPIPNGSFDDTSSF